MGMGSAALPAVVSTALAIYRCRCAQAATSAAPILLLCPRPCLLSSLGEMVVELLRLRCLTFSGKVRNVDVAHVRLPWDMSSLCNADEFFFSGIILVLLATLSLDGPTQVMLRPSTLAKLATLSLALFCIWLNRNLISLTKEA